MGYPRSEIYNRAGTEVYHCTVRCVRRAFLCGKDSITNRSYEHRREWIRARLALLGRCFAIEIIAYAIMSNHLHVIVRNAPHKAESWSNLNVAKRYRSVHPVKPRANNNFKNTREQIIEIAKSDALVAKYRERLTDLSWFMKALNEPLARRANKEDGCTGKFWEGRFCCKKVCSIKGIIACGVYVDLNPIKANMAKSPRTSKFTSIQQRIQNEYVSKSKVQKTRPRETTVPLIGIDNATDGVLSLESYLELVYKTGRALRNKGRSQKIVNELSSILTPLGIRSENWLDTVQSLNKKFAKAIASPDELHQLAELSGKAWLHGVSAGRDCFL